MEMRRKDLAVTDPARIDHIIIGCDCCHLAFADGTHPYIVPLNFGYERKDGAQIFYFHGAPVGRKVDLIRKLGYAGIAMSCNRILNKSENASDFSMRYQSIIGEGDIAELTELGEKRHALEVIMKQQSGRGDWEMSDTLVTKTGVFRLMIKELSAKEHN